MPTQTASFLGSLPASTTFTRNVATVDPLGVDIAANEPRYEKEYSWCSEPVWQTSGGSTGDNGTNVLGAGVDFDNTTELIVTRTSNSQTLRTWKFMGGTWTAQQTMSYATNNDLMGGAVAGKRYVPRGTIVHYGLVLIICERREDTGSGYTPVGTSCVYTNDYGATLTVAFDVTNSVANGDDEGLNRLREWSFTSTFPVVGMSHDVEAWVPWAEYVFPDGNTHGGVIGLFRLSRASNTATSWTLSANKLVHEEWDTNVPGTYHPHGAAITETGIVTAWGDVDSKNGFMLHSFALDENWLTNTVTTDDDWHGGVTQTGNDNPPSPQPVGACPGATPGSSLWSSDGGRAIVLEIGNVASSSDSPEITERIGWYQRTTTGTLQAGRLPLFIQYCPGYGYVAGGGSDTNSYMLSHNGIHWAQYPNVSDYDQLIYRAGNLLVTINSTNGVITYAEAPKVYSGRALLTQPGYDNASDGQVTFLTSAASGNTFTPYEYNDATELWERPSDGTALDPQPPKPPFPTSVRIHDAVCTNTTNPLLGQRMLTPSGSTVDLGETVAKAVWVYNMTPSRSATLSYRTGQNGTNRNDERGFKFSDNTDWMYIGRIDTHGAATAEARLWGQFWQGSSSAEPNVSRIYVAVSSVTESTHQPYALEPSSTSNPDERLVHADLNCGSSWTVSGLMIWPQLASPVTQTSTIATLWGDANNHIQIQQQFTSTTAGQFNFVVTSGGSVVGTINITGHDLYPTQPISWLLSSDGTNIYASVYTAEYGYGHSTLASQQLATQPTQYHAGNADQSEIAPAGHIRIQWQDDAALTSTGDRESEIIGTLAGMSVAASRSRTRKRVRGRLY